jgi:DMSO reductase anchor subunit
VLASTFHLGNPQRGIKAFKKLGSSWLSREILFTTLFLGIVFIYGALVYLDGAESLRRGLGMLGILASLALYLSSSMLYATISFIREWRNPFTVINFTIIGLTSGLLIGIAALAYSEADPALIVSVTRVFLGLGFASLLFKMATYHFNANHYQPLNEKNALSIFGENIRQTDMGTTYIHFNTKEYFYPITDSGLLFQRTAVLLLAFIIPLLLLYTMTGAGTVAGTVMPLFAFAVMTAGIIIERRLFFIEGTHIQNLYYGNFRKNRKANPIVSPRI